MIWVRQNLQTDDLLPIKNNWIKKIIPDISQLGKIMNF